MAKNASLLATLLITTTVLAAGCNTNAGQNAGPRTDSLVPNGGGRAGVMNTDQRTTDQPNANQTAIESADLPGGSTDQGRLTALGQNARVDNDLSTRVARLQGIRSATVLVSGDSAFVMVSTRGNAGTSGGGGGDINPRADVRPSIERQQGIRNNDTGNSTIYFSDTLESDVKARVSDDIMRANPKIQHVFFVNKWR